MICKTIKKGVECPFMKTSGCSYKGGICHEIVEQCQGCGRGMQISAGWYCAACPEPAARWKNGNCNLATHITVANAGNKQKINPLKASKRSKR